MQVLIAGVQTQIRGICVYYVKEAATVAGVEGKSYILLKCMCSNCINNLR